MNWFSYSNASAVMPEAVQMVTQQSMIVDPDNVKEAVLQGLRSIERGDFTELHTQEDLLRYFGDIINRGEKRLAALRKAARG
jgi:hypothetical protein